MPVKKLKEFLDGHKVKYVSINHSPAYTAQEVAQSAHIAGREMAKTVIIKVDGNLKMIVLPATLKIDLNSLKDSTKAKKVELASENEFNSRFPGCELGAMPPFGNLFGMEVLMAKSLDKNEQLVFNAGSHTELIKLAFKDFKELVKPTVVETI